MTISTQLSRQRYTTIPSRLQDAMFSVQTAEIMDGIAEQYHLDDEKVKTIGKIIGWVFLGFIHPEDVTKEIQAQLNLSPQIAAEIYKSVDAKIFAAVRSEIQQAYAPAPLSAEEEAIAPKIIQEIKPPVTPAPVTTVPAKPTIPAPKIISQTFDAASLTIGATPLSFNKDRPVPAPQPTKPPSNQGWSKQSPQQPVVKLGQVAPTVPSPAKIAPAIPTPATPVVTKPTVTRVGNSMSEFDRLDLMKKAPTAPSAPAPAAIVVSPKPTTPMPMPSKSSEPAPVMLHQISGTTAISQSPNLGMAAGTKNQIGANLPPVTSPTKPAVLEFAGKTPAPNPTQKVVHYSEYKTPVPAPIPASDTPRQVTQIVPPAPVPTPKTVTTPPPAPPKPPAPTIAGAQKVIVKDFLN